MAWPVNAAVVVRTLGNRRGTIVSAGAGGRYRVQVEGLTMWCREEDLAAPEDGRKGKRAGGKRRVSPAVDETAARPRRERGVPAGRAIRLDLHGLTVDDALARVEESINRALLDGADRLEIVHGRGTGRIRDALHRYLASLNVVAAFRLDQGNPGVTWVDL